MNGRREGGRLRRKTKFVWNLPWGVRCAMSYWILYAFTKNLGNTEVYKNRIIVFTTQWNKFQVDSLPRMTHQYQYAKIVVEKQVTKIMFPSQNKSFFFNFQIVD